ncbi:MAG: hypothetical protein JSS10_06325 [Verrucomicrobia bacterium]|nr:hypothetical protein [Verrucomicrobiota bacterium]
MFYKFSTALLVGLFFVSCSSQAETKQISQPFKKLSEVQHASEADYIFLQDCSGKEWIYKQITNPTPEDQIVVVLEVLASKIAQSMDIPINQVRVIPGKDSFEHRFFDPFPGTLHLKVAGKNTENSPPWEGFDLHQKFRTPFMVARSGPLPLEETGLRREVIQNMAKHPDLAKIAALDTYLGNNDRSNPNIFYDGKAFYGIDMGNCFMGNLAQWAYEKLKEFVEQKAIFTSEELLGLVRYRDVLQSLITQFPPARMTALLDHFLEEAGFVPNNPLLWDKGTEQKVRKWKLAIEENYQSSLKLVALLKKIGNQ